MDINNLHVTPNIVHDDQNPPTTLSAHPSPRTLNDHDITIFGFGFFVPATVSDGHFVVELVPFVVFGCIGPSETHAPPTPSTLSSSVAAVTMSAPMTASCSRSRSGSSNPSRRPDHICNGNDL